ncbi:MAG: biopolymer transporter ExbB [Gemmataceae bacterium]
MHDNQARRLAESTCFLIALGLVLAVALPLWQFLPDSGAWILTNDRLLRLMLGPEQVACYVCALWAALILIGRLREVQRQRRAFSLRLLPDEEGLRILPEDARPLLSRVEQIGNSNGPYYLARMLKLALQRFALTRSAQDASDTVRAQAEVDLGQLSASMATVHYLIWAIPAIGFIGTVRGIGMALTVVPLADMPLDAFLQQASAHLALAFDTTFVALVLSLVVMFLLHKVQREEESLVYDNQAYCLEKLVNRLYDLGHGEFVPDREVQIEP